MQRKNQQEIRETIEELYFEKLEDDGVDFIVGENIGNGQTSFNIKDTYIESIENMIDYVYGLDTWIGKWTLDLYNSAEKGN
jgi:hypothetical protein